MPLPSYASEFAAAEFPDGIAQEVSFEEVTATCDGPGQSSEELLKGYAKQRLDENLGVSDMSAQHLPEGVVLNDDQQKLLSELESFVASVASGETTYTVFSKPLSKIGLKTTWTAGDLGLSSLDDSGEISKALKQHFDFGSVIDALCISCPYEQYWADLTLGYSYALCSGYYIDGDEVVLMGDFEVRFPVAAAYAGDEAWTTSGNDAARINAALEKANSIVRENAGKNARDTLWAYSEAICELVTYDHAAAEGAVNSGDPWQLISVFDEDDSTNVVCEGYSKAFQYLCDLTESAGFNCFTAEGAMTLLSGSDGMSGANALTSAEDYSENHMWNIVQMDDGNNYLVDVTNCDEDAIGYPNQLFLAYGSEGSVQSGYLFHPNGEDLFYAYGESTLSLIPEEALTLSDTEYTEPDYIDINDEGYSPQFANSFDGYYDDRPYEISYLQSGEEPGFSLVKEDGTALDKQHYDLAWYDRDVNPDFSADEKDEEQARLLEAPTGPGHYYVRYAGVSPYTGSGLAVFDLISPDDIEYDFEKDRAVGPGAAFNLYREHNVWIGDSIGGYSVTNVEVASQNPEMEGEEVVALEPGEYDEWVFYAQNFGSATVEVSYVDVFGVEQSYTFNIDVVHELYSIDVRSESGVTRALPGKSIGLVAQPVKEVFDDDIDPWDGGDGDDPWDGGDEGDGGDSADEPEEELLTFEWRIADEDQDYATVTADPNDSSRATVTFYGANAGDGYVPIMEDVEVIVTMYGASGEDEPVERARQSKMLSVEDDFLALALDGWNDGLGPGLSQDVTAELRHYSINSQNEDGYDVVDDVLFTFYYDEWVLELTDSEGNPVYSGEPGDSSRGSSVPFTVKRTQGDSTNIQLCAEWGDSDHYEETFYLESVNPEVWLDSGMGNVFTDGTLDIGITYSEVAPDAYDTVVTVGVWDYMTEEWVQTFAEDSEFTVDGSTITLDGAKLFEACESEGSIRVFVELEADGVAIASNFCDVSLYESSVEYAFESDCEYLPGNAKHIRRWNNVYVKGPEYPDGENLEYEVVDVSIKSQVPETQGEDVVEVFKGEYNDDETGFDCYWECIAQNFGTATLEVTYRDLNGNDCTYTFNIDVVHVLYDIDVRSESGMTRALPGKSLDLVAQPMKEAYDDGDSADESEEELFTFVWRIADEDQGFATVTPDPNDSSRATVTFDEANVGDDYVSIMEDVEVIVTMYGAYGEDEPVERAWDSLMLSVEDDFLALVLDGWNEDLSPGLTQDVTAELRHYSISSQNEDGYDVFDDVLFTFNYDDEAVEITDSEGNKVLDDEYGDSSRGSSVPFTVKRLDTWNSTVTVYASWYDGEGYDSTSEYFRFNWCDFDFWLGSEWDALFDDGTLDVNIHYDGIAADAYDTVITVGVWDYMTEEWEQTFAEGSEFTVEGSTITLDGAKLFEACGGEEQIRIQAELKAGDVTVAENDHWIELREVLEENNLPGDRDMLPNSGFGLSKWYRGYVENAAHPDGFDFEYEVVGVEVVSQNPINPGDIVVEITGPYQADSEPGEIYWICMTKNFGTATVEMTYLDMDGVEHTHSFVINVMGEVYSIYVNVDSEMSQALPGASIPLHAEAWYMSSNGQDTKPLAYEWTVESGPATVEADGDDDSKAVVTFDEFVDGELQENQDVVVRCTLYAPNDDGEFVERTQDEVTLTRSCHYGQLVLLGFDPDMAIDATQPVTAEYRVYSVDCESDDGYDVKESVQFTWNYDDEAVEITDSEGEKVLDGEGIVGASVPFTIKRLSGEQTVIGLSAEWRDQSSSGSTSRPFFLNRQWNRSLRDCELYFDGEPWHTYLLQDKDDALSLEDLNITVRHGDDVVPSGQYDLVIKRQIGYDETADEPILEDSDAPYGIAPADAEEGFSTYCVVARAVAGGTYTDETELQSFLVFDPHSFNYVGASVDLGAQYKVQSTFSWHDYYQIPYGVSVDPVVRLSDGTELTDDCYTLTYFVRNQDASYENPVGEGYPEVNPLSGFPTEPGTYFARATGIDPYYGNSYVDFDILAPAFADYSAVDAAKARAAALDRTRYTKASLDAVDAAIAAVVEGKPASEQAAVDAMAQAIVDALDNLKEKPAKIWERVAGAERTETAAAIARKGGWPVGGTVMLARSDDPRDALAASGLAGQLDAPILITDRNSLSSKTAQELARLKPMKVYILGGTGAIKANVENQVKAAVTRAGAPAPAVERVSGATACLTSAAIMKKGSDLGYKWSDTALIATQEKKPKPDKNGNPQYKFEDALAVSPLAYALHMPIALATNSKTIDQGVINQLKASGIKKVYLVGGPVVLGKDIVNKLRANGLEVCGEGMNTETYNGEKLRLLAGLNSVSTSVNVAKFGLSQGLSASTVGVATNQNFPDALAGGPMCGRNRGVLVLIDNAGNSSIRNFVAVHAAEIEQGFAFGGSYVVTDKTFAALENATKG